MPRLPEHIYALIGRYIVCSMVVAAGLILRGGDMPLWAAFPIATILMIAGGALRGSDENSKR